ncbi:hypothetical protein K474DRAFT_1590028 [Panus rudis PR-1116 ss-1]|nr:hypothetical protein K474DRAFT_1590028 [Panus rudis PR-1116 ss-1]
MSTASGGHRPPNLPSVLPATPALQDTTATPERITSGVGKVTNPQETPIFICALSDCNRLFPSRDRLMAHRRTVHDTGDDRDIITWND